MAIPGYQTFMLPVLQLGADGEEHSLAEARETLAAQFKLTEEELHQQVPSGYQSALSSLVACATRAQIGRRHQFPQDRRNRLTWHRCKMGYGGSRQDAAKAVGRSGDEGIDGRHQRRPPGPGRHLPPSQGLGRHRGTPGGPALRRSPPGPAGPQGSLRHHRRLLQGCPQPTSTASTPRSC